MSYNKKIANQICNLVETLCNRFPNDRKLSLARTTLTALKNHNSRKLTEFYITQIYLKKNINNITFIQLVKDRNIDFFLQEDKLKQGQELAKSLNLGKNNDEAFIFIENLKNNWHELTQQEKEIVWTYFDVLNLLSEKYLTQQYLKEK
jgi:hypothetical protein